MQGNTPSTTALGRSESVVPIWLLAALLVAFSGALSPSALAGHINERLEAVVRAGLGGLGIVLFVVGLLATGRVRFVPMAVFGLLPWVYLVCLALQRDQLAGAFAYVYKFAPYLCAGVFFWLVARVSDRALLWTVLGVGTLISLRALFVFLFPYSSPERSEVVGAMDAFYVFEWVGNLPRVFYPGMSLIFLGLLLSVRGMMRLHGREQLACFAYLVIGSAGLLVSMIRGMILIAACLLVVEAAWCLRDPQADGIRKRNVLVGGLFAVAALIAAMLLSGYGEQLWKATGDLAGTERVTFDKKNLDWRQDQADAALSMMKTDQDWLLGMGTVATVPLSGGETVNELHFGYHSILWTFGILGVVVLVTMLLHSLAGGLIGPRDRVFWREMWLAIVFFSAAGGYTPLFTIPDGAMVMALSTVYVWMPRRARRAEQAASYAGSVASPTPRVAPVPSPARLWGSRATH